MEIMNGDRWTLPDLPSALTWCRTRNTQGIRCVMDVLGEYATTDAQVSTSLEAYRTCLRSIREYRLDASITVKLTSLGALSDESRCRDSVFALSREAVAQQVRFEIDMEGKDLAEYTVETALALAEESSPPTLALQAYLDRTPRDVNATLSSGIKVRLVKGAYLGDTDDFREIQKRFRSLCETIITQGHPFGIGTHDPEILDQVMRKVGSNRLLIEFGFLKGLGDETKVALAQKGWLVSEYVPYGADAKAYEARRMRYLKDLDHLGRRPVS